MSVNDHRKCSKCGKTRAEDETVTYHRFPNPGKANIIKARAWAKYCWPDQDWTSKQALEFLNKSSKVLCGRHFSSSEFYDNCRQKLSKFAVPDAKLMTELIENKEIIYTQTSSKPHALASTRVTSSRPVRSYSGSSTEGSDDDDDAGDDEDSSSRHSSAVPQIEDAKNESRVDDDNSIYISEVKEEPDGDLNEGFVCNQCQGLIVKFRYVCVECADYDLCGACEAQAHHAAHFMLRVPPSRDREEVKLVLSGVRAAVRLATATAPRPQLDHHDRLSMMDEIKIDIKEEVDTDELDPLSATVPSLSNEEKCEAWTHKSDSVDNRNLLQSSDSILSTSQTNLRESNHANVVKDSIVKIPRTSDSLISAPPPPKNTLMLTITPEDRGSYRLETSAKQFEDKPIKRSSLSNLDNSKSLTVTPQKRTKILPVKTSNVVGETVTSLTAKNFTVSDTSNVRKTLKLVKLSNAPGNLLVTKVKPSDVPFHVPQVKKQISKLVRIVENSENKTVTVDSASDSV